MGSERLSRPHVFGSEDDVSCGDDDVGGRQRCSAWRVGGVGLWFFSRGKPEERAWMRQRRDSASSLGLLNWSSDRTT